VGGSHYVTKKVQPWEAMEAWMSPEQFEGFLRGNAIKYLARYTDKGGINDVNKALHYGEKLSEHLASYHHIQLTDTQSESKPIPKRGRPVGSNKHRSVGRPTK